MKKLISLILGCVVALTAAACAGTTPTAPIDNPPPWCTDQSNIGSSFERIRYTVEKKDVRLALTTATGEMTFELSAADPVEGSNYSYSQLATTSSLTFTEYAAEADRGKTDTVSSVTVFQSEALVPVSSHKEVRLAPRDGRADLSYTIDANYREGKCLRTLAGETAELGFSGAALAGVYDNEMLVYAVRAFADVRAGGSGTFKLATFFDMFADSKFAPHPMTFSCGAEGSETALSFPALSAFLGDDQGSVSAVSVNISISDALSGPPINVMYSLTPFKSGDKYTRKVPVVITEYTYDVSRSELAYTTTYTISEYSTAR